MAVSYNGLWKLLIDNNMKKMDLVERVGISSSTLAKMSKGKIVYLGKRHLLSDWREEFKNDKAAVVRIEKYQELYWYAMEINEFQETTEISLGALRCDVSGFVVPQMYIYLDGTELLDYIENKIEKLDGCTVHDYSVIKSNEVCVH